MPSRARRPLSLAVGLFALSGCGGVVSLGTAHEDQRALARSLNPTSIARSWISAERLRRAPALLYVAQTWPSNSVTIYDQAGTNQQPIGVISGFNRPAGLAVDTKGNLYVANTSSFDIPVFKRGQITPFRTLSDPNELPYSIAVSRNGTVYVANIAQPSFSQGNVVLYAPGSNTPSAVYIDPNIKQPSSIAVDGSGNIFIYGYGEVDELKAGSSKWLITPIAITQPGDLKIDASGNVALFNGRCTCIETYQPDTWTRIKSFPIDGIGFFAMTLNGTGRRVWISRPSDTSNQVFDYKYKSGAFVGTIYSGLRIGGPSGIAAAPGLIP